MTENAWLWLYVACMAAGFFLFYFWSRDPRKVPHYEYAAAMFIPVWSGLAYTAMALGQGTIEVNGETIHFARYLDWLVTTPLLLFVLASSGMFFRPLDKTTIFTLIGLDVIMILSGLFADLSADGPAKWFWYLNGCVCLLLIFGVLWLRVRREAYAHNKDIGDAYTRIATLFTVLWIGYPTIWALGPSGLDVIGNLTETAMFVLLPIVSKVGFSIYDLHELRKLAPKYPQFDEEDPNAKLRKTVV